MADGKKSFLLYCDQIHSFETLEDDEAGRLIKHIFKYVNDQNPVAPDRITKISFEPIKHQLKRDLKKWDAEITKKSEGGKKGMKVRWGKSVKDTNKILKDSITPITDNVNVNVNVTDNVNVKRESNGTPAGIENSNLFRKPKIPTKHEVMKAITDAGGNKEMAKAFFEKHEGTGWFINNSPIVNYVALAQKFVSTWKGIEEGRAKKEKQEPTAPPLKRLEH